MLPDGIGKCKRNMKIDRAVPNLPANRYIRSRLKSPRNRLGQRDYAELIASRLSRTLGASLRDQARWRTASNSSTPAVTATLSESIAPVIGIDTVASHVSSTRGRTPVPSAPSTKMQPSV